MEKGRFEFSITFLEPGGNFDQNGIEQFRYLAKSASQPAIQPIA